MDDSLEDYDFTPSANSNLASLFGISSMINSGANTTLTYTAPKQPKPVQNEGRPEKPKEDASSVLCVKIATVWKLVGDEHTLSGKLGVALIGSDAQNLYEIILYKERTNVLARAIVNGTFKFSLKKDNFASFYDNKQQYWLLKFNSKDDFEPLCNLISKYGGKVLDIPPDHTVVKSAPEPMKSEVDKEASADGSKTQNDILTRIARMGQSILPAKPKVKQSISVSDSEDEAPRSVNGNTSANRSPIPSPRSMQVSQQSYIPPTQNPPNMVYIPPTHNPGNVVVQTGYDPLSLVLLETRTQGTEVKMKLADITDKLNQVLQTVQFNSSSPRSTESDCSNDLKRKTKVLQLQVENLSRELRRYEEKYSDLEEKHRSLLSVEEKRPSLAQIENYEQEITAQKEEIHALKDTLATRTDELNSAKTELSEALETNAQSEATISALNNTVSELISKVDAGDQPQDVSDEKLKVITETLKQSMSDMFNNIMSSFGDDTEFSSTQIREIVGRNIKYNTLKMIRELQDTSRT